MSAITTSQAGILSFAFDFFNARLFGGALPDALIVLHRHNEARGYHQHGAYRARVEDAAAPFVNEIALNPATFAGRSDRQIFSTLVHEMVHLWQAAYGGDYKQGQHNREWAAKMESIGLVPSHTGEPGGRRTGRRVSHYIALGGPFDLACADLLRYVHFQYEAVPAPAKARKETVKRVKLACPLGHDVEVRAVPGTRVRCGECDELLEEVG
jgi:predicted SprT family Zn-dependent metalloprotease